uniref:Uncharacterized protein n=1 Tax=Aegilops tauschii TaxID=37682 RepID=M8CET3_AEGTA
MVRRRHYAMDDVASLQLLFPVGARRKTYAGDRRTRRPRLGHRWLENTGWGLQRLLGGNRRRYGRGGETMSFPKPSAGSAARAELVTWKCDNGTYYDTGRFDALVASLVGALSDWAAFNTTTRYASGVMVSDQGFPTTPSKDLVHRINGLVQCTPDQAPGRCRECLQGLIDEMPAVFNGSVGGRILAVWCNLRFEVHEFYDGSPMLKLTAP